MSITFRHGLCGNFEGNVKVTEYSSRCSDPPSVGGGPRRRSKNIPLLLHCLAVCVVIFLSQTALVFSGEIPGNGEALKQNAEETLNALKEAYQNESLDGFFRLVSDDAYIDVSDLKFKIAQRFSDFSGLELVFFVDKTVVEKNKVLLETHWQRRGVNSQTGRVETHEGKAHLTFEAKEEKRLLNIQNESPF